MTPEELFDKYQMVAHWYVCKFLPTRLDDEDYHQIALLGLWKACCTYNESLGYTFTTYSIACIRKEFDSYHKHIHRPKRAGDLTLISLDKQIDSLDSEVYDITLLDTLEDPKSIREFDGIFAKEFLEYMLNSPKLKESQRKLIILMSKGYTSTQEIMEKLGVTRQRVSQIKKSIKKKFGEEYYR